MERTTIRLHEPLLSETKRFAAAAGKSMTAVIEDALTYYLSVQKRARKTSPVKLKTVDGEGLQAPVDIDNNAELFDFLDGLPPQKHRRAS